MIANCFLKIILCFCFCSPPILRHMATFKSWARLFFSLPPSALHSDFISPWVFFLSIGQTRTDADVGMKTVDGSLIFCFFSAVSLFCGAYFTTEGRLAASFNRGRDETMRGDGQTINYSARVGYPSASGQRRGPFLSPNSPKATTMDDGRGRFWNLNLYRGIMQYLPRKA